MITTAASRGRPVVIYRLLQNSTFGPEEVERMGTAYELALAKLGLKDGDDPLNETVAKLVIEVAQTGEKDPKVICERAISRLNGSER